MIDQQRAASGAASGPDPQATHTGDTPADGTPRPAWKRPVVTRLSLAHTLSGPGSGVDLMSGEVSS
jgi:hypothetical protein